MNIKQHSLLKNLTIEKVIFKGMGLAHYEANTILVYQGITGDDVDVNIIHKRGDTYFATISAYNKRSPLQIPVNCDVFDSCGGCDWLHIDYETQLRIKQQIFNDLYYNTSIDDLTIGKIIPSPKINHYRNKIILPVTMIDSQIKTGMYSRRSHQVIPHDNCYLHSPEIESLLRLTEELLTKSGIELYDETKDKGNLKFIGIRYSETRKEHLLVFVTKTGKLPFSKILVDNVTKEFPSVTGILQDINKSPSNKLISSKYKTLFGNDYLIEELPQVTLRYHYSSFFQINTLQCINILNTVEELVSPEDIVIDAYSGIGTFGLAIAPKVKKVILLEQHQEAVTNGMFNIKENNLDNCTYISGDVERTLSAILKTHKADTIIFDPPRKGLESSIIDTVISGSINKIIYLSCDISTQKRDLDQFAKGGFRITKLQPFDMFPHTYHLENVTLMQR